MIRDNVCILGQDIQGPNDVQSYTNALLRGILKDVVDPDNATKDDTSSDK